MDKSEKVIVDLDAEIDNSPLPLPPPPYKIPIPVDKTKEVKHFSPPIKTIIGLVLLGSMIYFYTKLVPHFPADPPSLMSKCSEFTYETLNKSDHKKCRILRCDENGSFGLTTLWCE